MHIKWGSSSKCVFAFLSCDKTHFSKKKKKGVLGGQLFQTKVSPPHLLAEVGWGLGTPTDLPAPPAPAP